MYPSSHRDYVRERHADLLRQARTGRLAAEIAESRRAERRSRLARFRPVRRVERPATSGI